MRSLFAKVLLWFLATTAITGVGFLVTTALSVSDPQGRQYAFARLLQFQLGEARHAYEAGGKQGLTGFLNRLRDTLQAEAVLTDAAGRDLLTGEDRSALITGVEQRSRRRFPLLHFRGNRAVIARAAEDGQYWLFLFIPRGRVSRWFVLPQHLWVLAAVVLLCYALALHLSAPVRQLQKAVERFGQGDLSARVGSSRRDELGQLAGAFDQMADRIQTLMDAERRLLLDISHELRSPLARLGVAIELARSGEDQDAALDRIQKESERLNALVAELLQVTRAEGDPLSLNLESVRLDELLRLLVEDCAIEAKARLCSLELDAAQPITIPGDPELLRRAIENIIRNAIRYAPKDSKIEITADRNGATASVRVRDYGPGVPEEALRQIFDPFYRVERDRNRDTGGVGLGLAIARRAVELHKGRLSARNANPGLLVEMDLPQIMRGAF